MQKVICRVRGVARRATTFHIGQQRASCVRDKLLTHGDFAGTEPATLAIDLVVSFVFDIPKAQRPRVECVFVFVCRPCDSRPIQLGVSINGDIKAAFARLNARLFIHRLIIAVHLGFSGIDAAVHTTRLANAATRTHAGLFGIVLVDGLLARQG